MLSEADLVILARASLAAALGFVIGWERQAAGGAIRARTLGLAALTAAMLTALGHEIFATGTDRVVQGIVTGIGFLGAGVIIRGASGELRGLTTAASLWAMTGIGVAVGSGHELLGVLLAGLVYVIAAWGDWPVLAAARRAAARIAHRTASQRSDRTPSGGTLGVRSRESDEMREPAPSGVGGGPEVAMAPPNVAETDGRPRARA